MPEGDGRSPGLLGFLATRLAPHPENVATEALEYLLRTSASVARAFEDYLRRVVDLPTGLHYDTQSGGEDGAIPDLVGFAPDGSSLLLLEAKFRAGLTGNQPVSYLQRLPVDRPALLLFVVPSTRIEVLWAEILIRAAAAGFTATGEQDRTEYRHAPVGAQRALAMTSWRVLLTVLCDAADATGDHNARADLGQLWGLCELMDSQRFVPLAADDLSGAIADRLLQYTDLMKRAVDRSVVEKTASLTYKGTPLKPKSGDGWWGRYLNLAGVRCLLRVSAEQWAEYGATPIWLQVGYKREPQVPVLLNALAPLRAQQGRVYRRNTFVDVAIDLPVDVEIDDVVKSMVDQIREVASCLMSLGLAG